MGAIGADAGGVTFFGVTGAGVISVVAFGSRLGSVMIGKVIFGTAETVEEASEATRAGMFVTVTLPEKATMKVPRTSAATMPR